MYTAHALTSRSPEEIRASILRRLQAALPELSFVTRKEEPYRLTLSHPETGELVLNLGNLVHEVLGAKPHVAEDLVNNFVNLAKRAVAPPKIALDSVFPGLRHRAFLDAAGQKMSDPMIGEGPGDLLSVILSDQGEGVATLNAKAVRAAGFAPEDVLAAAERNFVDLLPGAFSAASPCENVMLLGLKDFPWLGSSLLFVPSLISRVMEERGWESALLALPTRETVDLIDASAPDAPKLAERWMTERLAGSRTQSDVVYTFHLDDTDYRKTHLMVDQTLVRLN